MSNCVNVYDKMKELGITLPPAPADSSSLKMIRPFGEKLLYVSGMGCNLENETFSGHVLGEVSLEDGVKAARNCALNALAALHGYLGDLNKIQGFVKLLAFVSSDANFYEQHIVVNGASDFIIELFGAEVGKSARSAVGVAALPKNFAVEVEMLVELK